MDDHLQAVLTAKTPGDLVPVLASLPDTNTGRTLILAGKSGRFRRRGAWRVPRVLKVESEYGKVDLDLFPGKSSRTQARPHFDRASDRHVRPVAAIASLDHTLRLPPRCAGVIA
jgi:hypothetical protein